MKKGRFTIVDEHENVLIYDLKDGEHIHVENHVRECNDAAFQIGFGVLTSADYVIRSADGSVRKITDADGRKIGPKVWARYLRFYGRQERKHRQSIDGFSEMVRAEYELALRRFPYPNQNLAALMEEVGELARAFLQDESPERIYAEAVQVAAMAARCALEGDPQFEVQP